MLNLRRDDGYEGAGELSSERAVFVRGGLDPAPSVLLVCVRFKGEAWSRTVATIPTRPLASRQSHDSSAEPLCILPVLQVEP